MNCWPVFIRPARRVASHITRHATRTIRRHAFIKIIVCSAVVTGAALPLYPGAPATPLDPPLHRYGPPLPPIYGVPDLAFGAAPGAVEWHRHRMWRLCDEPGAGATDVPEPATVWLVAGEIGLLMVALNWRVRT